MQLLRDFLRPAEVLEPSNVKFCKFFKAPAFESIFMLFIHFDDESAVIVRIPFLFGGRRGFETFAK